MGDEYVSVEHLFLSLLRKPSKEIKQLFHDFQIDQRKIFASSFESPRKSKSDNGQSGSRV